MGARLLFVSFTIAPKFMIEKHSLFTLWKCGQNKTQGARLRFPPLPYWVFVPLPPPSARTVSQLHANVITIFSRMIPSQFLYLWGSAARAPLAQTLRFHFRRYNYLQLKQLALYTWGAGAYTERFWNNMHPNSHGFWIHVVSKRKNVWLIKSFA